MAWVSLIFAGLFEMIGVMMINQFHLKKNIISFLLLIFAFIASFIFLSIAMDTLSMGTAYAVWTGIGAAGGAIMGMLFYGEQTDWKRIFFLSIIIIAVIGLKWLN